MNMKVTQNFVLIIILTSLLSFGNSNAQNKIQLGENIKVKKYSTILDPSLRMFLNDYQLNKSKLNSITAKEFFEKQLFEINWSGNQISIPLLIQSSNYAELESKIIELGGKVFTRISNILTAEIPLSKLEELSEVRTVSKIEASYKSEYNDHLDLSKIAIQANDVHNGIDLPKEYRGKNVLIGVVDSGLDWTHPDFNGSEGTRVLYLWDQSGESNDGNPPTGFNYGVEYTKEDIDQGNIDQQDENGHGTHVTSTAAGSGLLNEEYTGIAPDANIIFTKPTTLSDVNIVNGVKYLSEKAKELGKQIVINISIGGHSGPHDGSSLYEQALNTIGENDAILVISAGNSGSSNNLIHLSYATEGNSLETGFSTPVSLNSQQAVINLWYDEGSITVGVVVYNNFQEFITEYNLEASPSNSSIGVVEDSSGNPAYQVRIDASTTNDLSNNASTVQIRISSMTGANLSQRNWGIYTYGTGEFDAWGVGNTVRFYPFDNLEKRIKKGDNLKTVGVPGTIENAITVANYVTKNSWTTYTGIDTTIESSTVGDLAASSSKGPTRDGRQKPDIAAPGEFIAAARSSAEETMPSFFRLEGERYMVLSGTSMAAPHVTGAVGLLLEKNPNLTLSEVKDLLSSTAQTDEFTGSVPNYFFGYGKMNVHKAIKNLVTSVEDESLEVKFDLSQNYPNPFNPTTVINYSIPSKSKVTLKVYDVLGKEIAKLVDEEKSAGTHNLEFDASNLSSGVYFYRINAGNFQEVRKMMLIK